MVIESVERANITPYPDERGRFGRFGGQYAPETLMPALEELEAAWEDAKHDVAYLAEIRRLATDYVGRQRRSTKPSGWPPKPAARASS